MLNKLNKFSKLYFWPWFHYISSLEHCFLSFELKPARGCLIVLATWLVWAVLLTLEPGPWPQLQLVLVLWQTWPHLFRSGGWSSPISSLFLSNWAVSSGHLSEHWSVASLAYFIVGFFCYFCLLFGWERSTFLFFFF